MRRRSGALHCQTEEELLELANNNQLGLFYDNGSRFRQVKFEDQQWNLTEAQNQNPDYCENFQFNQEESEAVQQQKQLSKGKRYLQNCIVDKQTIRWSIQICIIADKIEDVLNKIIGKDSLLNFFIHSKESGKNCIYKHSTIDSSPQSNVFCLKTHDFQSCKREVEKQNFRLSPKNWLKNTKNERMMELIIVKKHIGIGQNSEIEAKRITIIHRIFIVNRKYIQNQLIKIYLQKSHFVVQFQDSALKGFDESPTKLKIYQKLFNHKSLIQKQCSIFNKGQYFCRQEKSQTETVKFKNVFHKIEERIVKNYMRKLNQVLIQEKLRSSNKKSVIN